MFQIAKQVIITVVRIAQILEALLTDVQRGRRGGGRIETRRNICGRSIRGVSIFIEIVVLRGIDSEISGSQRGISKAYNISGSNIEQPTSVILASIAPPELECSPLSSLLLSPYV